ncbi:MAG TPA: zinc-dependent metalloprotease [Puia sp.]|nr:zinc-dependent metalloprotease [Puia sp.]
MKNPRLLILACLSGLFSLQSFAQPICGFDAVHARELRRNAQFRQNVQKTESFIRGYIQQHPELLRGRPSRKAVTGGKPAQTLAGPYYIPVVVHVIHTGGDVGTIYNPSDAQILGAIDYLNSVYNGTWPGTEGAGDLGIQFVLARRDPNCNPTNGINRIDGSPVAGYVSGGINVNTTLGTDETNIKSLSRWDNTQYYNVWIVNKIDGNDGTSGQFIAGYARFPGGSAGTDGIVMLATQMIAGQKTLPHEMGHAFNLYHPFQGSSDVSTCPTNTDCTTDGDQVCDTDPISENISGGVVDFTPRTGQANACAGNTQFTINTEHNYMNYTDSFTLFTVGQAARLQASAVGPYRSSLTTSPGGTAPSGGGCSIPKIDFELTGDRETESTATSSGCRAYKDYTYNMEIGLAPSATATATLSVSSATAVQGLDYDITTNGDFTSPSMQLTFPTGSIAAESFTVRVYNDASVNGTRQFTLGFTVNNGGGNATPGDGRPNFTMIIDDNDVAPNGPTTVTGSIGTDEGAFPTSPFAASSGSNKSQLLYYPTELTAQGIKAGNITGLSLNIEKVSSSSFVYQGLTIKMAATSDSSLYNGTTEFPISEAAFTTVYNSDYTTTSGWNSFTFATPFAWDGTSSVVIEICYNNGSTTGPADDLCEGYLDGTSHYNYIFAGIACGTSYSSFSGFSGEKPMIRLEYADPGATVQTALNSSKSEYLGPNADVYFYDQTNGQLMARIQNLSGFDYGCTQVVLDRAGTSATQFWNSTPANYLMDKTFHVLPATNSSSGSYTITLYYTQAEVDGWQTATGQTLSSIQLVKVPGQISQVTPASPNGAGTVTTATPTISSVGTNTGLTYNFTNGFSGFGAGVPGISPLPLTLLDFSGRLHNNNTELSWSTSSEENTKSFEIERSFDGLGFTPIGSVPAAGNSPTTRNYSFTDAGLTHDTNYYRLRLIDRDDRFTYSKTVLVRAHAPALSFSVAPNPFTDGVDLVFGQAPAGAISIRLLDLTGRELWQGTGMPSGGNRLHIRLPGPSLSAGVYLLEVTTDTGTQIEKILKK